MTNDIDQRYLWEFMLSEAGIEAGECIGLGRAEVAQRLLVGDFVGLASKGGLTVAVAPVDDELVAVTASDFDLGPGFKLDRVVQLDNDQRSSAVRDTREALCIAVSRAFEGYDDWGPQEEHSSPLHASEAQALLVASGLPWESWDVRALQRAAYLGYAIGELDADQASEIVTDTEAKHLVSLGIVR